MLSSLLTLIALCEQHGVYRVDSSTNQVRDILFRQSRDVLQSAVLSEGMVPLVCVRTQHRMISPLNHHFDCLN
jgi:hypothetical protein